MPFITYILFSPSLNRYYTGSCEHIALRLEQHNTGRNTSTKAGVPWKIVYIETFTTRAEAQSREIQIKRKKSRKYIEWLISSAG